MIEVTRTSEFSLFSKIRLVQEAQSEMPPSQNFIKRFERIYAKVIIIVTLGLTSDPRYLLEWSWNGN